MTKLVLLLLAVPLIELWLLFVIGGAIGFWSTLGLVVGMALLGTALAKHEGRRVLGSWQSALATGQVPDEGITSGFLVLLGAVLLLIPGVLTDVVGLLLLIPPTRRRIASAVRAWLERRASQGHPFAGVAASPGGVHMRVIQFGSAMPGAFWSDPSMGRGGHGGRGPRGQVIDVNPDEVVVEEVDTPRGGDRVKGLLR
ncbi:FxsA family protein [Chondromyces apiculatus]|uniref:FxsA protein n=1 Tax=Chondromyces apiculatus DSM 436 TaxID=1192034 RepID=A0A017TAG1_9BACT|nr:FxsA family protein [Chondromyces apiculatus]EYF05820.1 Hypothetical protein CAP_2821 [Chondromyces apiculatus DSM 436]